MPKVSIIIPAYNSAEFLSETLNSIFEQTFKDYEVIIIDDGSTDNTKEILKPYYGRINYFYQANSGGPAKPRNLGVNISKGQYIAFFDSDDVMMPTKLEKSVHFLESSPNLPMLFTNFYKTDAKGEPYPGTHLDTSKNFRNLEKTHLGDHRYLIRRPHAFEGLFFENYIGTSGVTIQKELFSTVGLFDETLSYGGLEDRDMWFRVTHLYDVGYLDIVGHGYRVRHGSVSRRIIASNTARASVIKKYSGFITSSQTRHQANFLRAKCYYGLGYHHQAAGDLRTARSFFLRSLKACLFWPSLRGIFISLLGTTVLRLFKTTFKKNASK